MLTLVNTHDRLVRPGDVPPAAPALPSRPAPACFPSRTSAGRRRLRKARESGAGHLSRRRTWPGYPRSSSSSAVPSTPGRRSQGDDRITHGRTRGAGFDLGRKSRTPPATTPAALSRRTRSHPVNIPALDEVVPQSTGPESTDRGSTLDHDELNVWRELAARVEPRGGRYMVAAVSGEVLGWSLGYSSRYFRVLAGRLEDRGALEVRRRPGRPNAYVLRALPPDRGYPQVGAGVPTLTRGLPSPQLTSPRQTRPATGSAWRNGSHVPRDRDRQFAALARAGRVMPAQWRLFPLEQDDLDRLELYNGSGTGATNAGPAGEGPAPP